MIIRALVQLKGESAPQEHYALVIEDAICPQDFIAYRNALTTAAKALVTDEESLCHDEVFWLIQLAEFISTSLDMELQKKGVRYEEA